MTSIVSKPPTRGWPPERRAAQAARIRQRKPWLHSTGPRTAEGKRRASLNAVKHYMRSSAMRRIRAALRRYRVFLASLTLSSSRRRPGPMHDSGQEPQAITDVDRALCPCQPFAMFKHSMGPGLRRDDDGTSISNNPAPHQRFLNPFKGKLILRHNKLILFSDVQRFSQTQKAFPP